MHKIILILLMIAAPQFLSAQEEEKEIKKVIQQMFDGMRAGDSALVSDVFHPNLSFASTFFREGEPNVRFSEPSGFLKAVGTPHDEVWDERIKDLEIHIEDNLAVAWMKFAFFRGDAFSHCGVNAFTLGKTSEGWKIIFVSDTRKRTDCEAYGKE